MKQCIGSKKTSNCNSLTIDSSVCSFSNVQYRIHRNVFVIRYIMLELWSVWYMYMGSYKLL
jgi:hypothetical protein